VTQPLRHFPDDLLRAHAVGAASEGATLAVACHLTFCPVCEKGVAAHESVLEALVAARPDDRPSPALRNKLIADLPPQPAAARKPAKKLPKDLPELPAPLRHHLGALDRVGWKRLIPGLKAIDLGIDSAWRARLVRFRPGMPIPVHDHDGPEHVVVFSGGLDDETGHLGRGDAATMMPGDTHRQRSSRGEACVALIVSEGPPRPLTFAGRVLKNLTRS
jgi:putative transcriptional regulator